MSRPLRPLLHRLRWIKSPAEIELLAASCSSAARALRACIAHTQPGLIESDFAARFQYETALRGAERLSFPPVVGAGEHACTIHYGRNDAKVSSGDLILMDAGCEHWGYASDMTRTWPANGRFTHAQRLVYEHVLRAHEACVAEVRLPCCVTEL